MSSLSTATLAISGRTFHHVSDGEHSRSGKGLSMYGLEDRPRVEHVMSRIGA